MMPPPRSPTWRSRARAWREFAPSPLPGLTANDTARIVVAGTGPIGLAQAIDLGQRGHPVVVLSRSSFIPAGSRAICFSKRSLEILDRLGVGAAAVKRGVIWNVGKVFWRDNRTPIYQFDMLPVKNQKMPGFINLQQYELEELLLARLTELPNVDLRWGHEVTGIVNHAHTAELTVTARDGTYRIQTDWLIACDGSRSPIRGMLGLDFDGRTFEDNFLIADIRMSGERPSERWFWFDPPFNPDRSVLMHKQPNDIWRLDFQLGWNINREECIKPENVEPLVRAMLGKEVEFKEEWYSVYTFQCRRMARFVHDRVIFAGDSAHLVSPFGARGCNGGFADIDNLGWKLDLVLRGEADPNLIESYNDEALICADENILNSTRSTDFLTPKSKVSAAFRDAVLALAGEVPFARNFVNSGRLSTPVGYAGGALLSPDLEDWCGKGIAPGFPALDAPVSEGWLLERLGNRFMLLTHHYSPEDLAVPVLDLAQHSDNELALARFALERGSAYLIRPDQYVAARWKQPSREAITAALDRARGKTSPCH